VNSESTLLHGISLRLVLHHPCSIHLFSMLTIVRKDLRRGAAPQGLCVWSPKLIRLLLALGSYFVFTTS